MWGFLVENVGAGVVSLGDKHVCLLSHLGGPGVAVVRAGRFSQVLRVRGDGEAEVTEGAEG